MNTHTPLTAALAMAAVGAPLVCQAQDPANEFKVVTQLRAAGKNKEALETAEKVLKVYGNPASRVAQQFAFYTPFFYWQKAEILTALGEYDKALSEHKKALRLRRDNHLQQPDIAASLNWIGNDLIQLGRLQEAKEQLEESLNIRKKVLDKRHPDLAWALISLSEYYEKMGEFLRAIQLMQEAYDIRKEQLRPGHPYTKEAEQRLNEIKKKADGLNLTM